MKKIKSMVSGVVGLIELDEKNSHIHFSEWWNGEGLDHTMVKDNKEIKFSLHLDEMNAIAAFWLKSGFIDLNEVKKLSEEIEDRCK